MRSDASTVDAYLADLPENRRAKLDVIRRLCREHLPEHEETMQFGMPVYIRAGQTEFAWASQARYISLYIMKEGVVSANSDRLTRLDMGKGCLRLRPSEEIDTELVRDLLIATAASSEQPC